MKILLTSDLVLVILTLKMVVTLELLLQLQTNLPISGSAHYLLVTVSIFSRLDPAADIEAFPTSSTLLTSKFPKKVFLETTKTFSGLLEQQLSRNVRKPVFYPKKKAFVLFKIFQKV